MFKKVFFLLLCMKFIFLDPFSFLPSKAQTTNDFSLATVQSKPVSFDTSLLPTSIKLSSLPVSFSTSNFATAAQFSSNLVSFSTTNFAAAVQFSSNPVSFSASQTVEAIKLSSLPVSYSLTSFTGEAFKSTSDNVSYKVFNGIPILDLISPNLLPISQNGSSIDISLQGENFVQDAVATIGTLKIQTKYVSQDKLIATIPANYLNKENGFEIFVANPPPKGGVSQGFNVMVVNPIPIAKINATPNIGVAPQIVTFDGRNTEDLLAKYFGQALSYSWNLGDLENETEQNPNTSTDPVISHTYKKPGKYTASLNVVNAYGKTSTVTKEIEIREKNFAPEGTFTLDKLTGDVPLNVAFTTNITDKENDEISYLWEFGDGQTSTEINPSHTYTIPGKYQPKLTVTDIIGAKTTITSTRLTLFPPNNLPITEIAVVPRESTLKLNNNGLFTSEVQFVSNGTYDPDNEELTYLWDFGDNETSNQENPKHEYKNPGDYNVKLTVTDIRNGQSSKSISTTVLKPQPIANAKLDQTTGNAPFEVIFDGSSSQDYDGKAVSIKFDFGDGISQTLDSTQGIIKHTYQDPGVYLTSITAFTTDNRLIKTNIGNIIVGPNNAPVGQITKLEGEDNGILSQAMIKLSAQGSFDPSQSSILSPQSSLQYKWSWNARTWDINGNLIDISNEINSELTANNEEIFEYTFTKAGQFTPVLEVKKLDGSKSNFYGETYTITPDQAPVAIAKILSDKSIGEPGLEVSFDASESYDPKAGGGLQILTWDFGDGEKSTEIAPKHTYNSEGTFTPTLVVVDNGNNVGFAQTASIKITNFVTARSDSNEALFRLNNVMLSDSKESSNVKRFFVADAPQNDSYTEEEIQSAINAKAKEITNTFISTDNQKPEIGPISIEPKVVNPGGAVRLSCFVRDNIGLSNFIYTLYGANEKIITQKVIDLASKNKDNAITSEQYLEENISIPENLAAGTYKIKLSATDTSGNQIAKNDSSSEQSTNEEIAVTFDVSLNTNELTASTDRVVLPSNVSEFVEQNTEARVYGRINTTEKEYKYIVKEQPLNIERHSEAKPKNLKTLGDSSVAEFTLSEALGLLQNDINIQDLINQGFFVRGFVGEAISPQNGEENEAVSIIKTREAASTSTSITKTTKLQTTGFEVTSFNQVTNPWVTISPSTSNSLTLDVISERDGYIEIGWKGSLASTPFVKWTRTNVYVDSKFAGSIQWWAGAGVSFSSTSSNPSIKVEFRPTDSLGNELAQVTWTSGIFTFTKITQPQVSSILPTEGTAARGAFDLRINGSNFRETSRVYFDGYLLTPFANDTNTIYVRVPANLVQYLGGKSISVLNSDGSQSNVSYYTAKANQNNACNLKKTLPQTYWGSDSTTVLSGNNTYLSPPSSIIQGSGSVSIPFCLDNTYDVKTSLNLSHYKSGAAAWNYIDFWIDGSYIGRNFVQTSQSLSWENLDTRALASGLHELKISFNGGTNDLLYVNDSTFTNSSGPKLYSINPNTTSLEGNKRTLTINGDNFDQNTNITIDNQTIVKNSVSKNQITVYIPDKFSSPGAKPVQLHGNGKDSTILSLAVTDDFKLIDGSFKITPVQPFPGNNFDIELKIKGNNSNATYLAYVAVFDPDGKLLTTINNSNNFSTLTLSGIKDSNGDTFFKGSVPLSLQSKSGNYKVITAVQRNTSAGEELTSIEALKYLAAKGTLNEYPGTLIPASHRLTFTPKPAVGTVFGIEENNSENIGFVQVGNKVVQDGQSVKYKVQIATGQEYTSYLRYNFKSGDGRESAVTANDNYTFTYQNTNKSSTTPQTANPQVEIFWNENGVQTKIGTYNGPTIFTYPNYSPIAKAKVSGETFSTTPPLFTTFTDLDSYDPNQRFSSAIDFVDSKLNDWKLYELRFNQDSQLVSLPIDGKVSEDGKTFNSGSLYTPGSYFAKLTVKDKTGLTDSSSTESVTLTKPSQRVIVFATTNPSDKKVYDPSNVILSASEESHIGIPVKFKSDVKVLGGHVQSQTYKWDFGDGSCKNTETGGNGNTRNGDCFLPNPTHYYFDGDKSFNGTLYTDRKSVTPKLTVTTVFNSGKKETWEAIAGTITFNAEPNFVLLDVKPDQASGIVPFTVNLMIDSATAKAVNATVSKYELDWGNNVILSTSEESHIESENITFDQLLTKTFTHTYTNPGTYTPKLTIYINESTRKFVFNIPQITVSGTGTGGVYLLDDLSNLSFTNQPIITFMVLASYANPADLNNSLKIKVTDEDNNETITELEPGNSNQTIALSEGKNTYYFETSDSSNQVIMSEVRNVVLDTIDPDITDVSSSIDESGNISVSGTLIENNFQKLDLQVNDQVPQILSSDEVEQVASETDEYLFSKTLNNIQSSFDNLILKAYDFAGNISESKYSLNTGNNKIFLERIENHSTNSPSTISNPIISNKKLEKLNIHETAISGRPFDIQLLTCFSDDLMLSNDGVEASFDISSVKLKSIKHNNVDIQKTDIELQSLFESLVLQKNLGCVDIANLTGNTLKKLSCEDAYATSCRNTCVHLNDFICNIPAATTKKLNTYTNSQSLSSLFSPVTGNLDAFKAWDVGTYEFKFEVNENPTTCSAYGTCIGQNYSENKTSQTYTFTIDIKRDPIIQTKNLETQVINSTQTQNIETGNLIFNSENKVNLQITVIDNLPFSTTRTPSLNIGEATWSNGINPALMITSESIDQADPRKYIFNISTTITPEQTESIKLSIPVNLPEDYFSPDGFSLPAEFELPIITNIPAEITAPTQGSLVTGKELVTSMVTKPQDLPVDLDALVSCKKSEIFYGIKLPDQSSWITLQKSASSNKLYSKGKSTSDGGLEYQNILNFNLKNNSDFKKGFLDGSIFGPIKLAGEYSTACNSTFVQYKGNAKTYILLDNSTITKGKCSYPQNAENSKCKFTISTNTLLDSEHALVLDITPNNGTITTECKNQFPQITFTNPKKLTKTVKIDCLPKEATSFNVKLKRNNNFLNEIENKLIGTGLSTVTNPSAITAYSMSYAVNNVPEEEDNGAVFEVGDSENKSVSFDFLGQSKTLSVSELKDFLSQYGYGNYFSGGSVNSGYTEDVDTAFKAYISNFKTALQRLENEYGISVNISEDGSISYSEVSAVIRNQEAASPQEEITKRDIIYIQLAKEFLEGLKDGGVNEVNGVLTQLQDPTVLMFIITAGVIFAGVSSSTVLLSWMPIITTTLLIGGITAAEIDTLNQAITYYANQNNPSIIKLFGFVNGKLITATVALDGIAQLIERLAKLRWFSKLIKTNSLSNYSKIQTLLDDELKSLNSITSTEERLITLTKIQRFTQILDKLSDSAKTVLSNVIQRLIDRNYDKLLLIKKLGLTSDENLDLITKVINRDGLSIILSDQELNDLVFTITRSVEDVRLNAVAERVSNNLITGTIPETVTVGRRILREDAALQVLNGERTLSNEIGVSFLSEINNLEFVSDIDLIKILGYDNTLDIKRFLGQKVYIFELPLNGLTTKLPKEGNINFVKGGITSGGNFEFITEGGWPSNELSRAELEALGVVIKERSLLRLSEIEIRSLLNDSLNPPTSIEVEQFIDSLKGLELI